MPCVLVVDPHESTRIQFKEALASGDFEIAEARSAAEALRFVHNERPDLIVLDLFLEDQSGFAVCRGLRADPLTQELPILVLTHSNGDEDRILALEAGADDVVSRPFYPRELASRLRALLRRVEQAPRSGAEPELRFGPLRLDSQRRSVRVGDRAVEFTDKEFMILALLIQRPGRVFRREEMVDKIWGKDEIRTPRVIDTHVKAIRKKLGDHGNVIKSLHGVGYRLEAPEV